MAKTSIAREDPLAIIFDSFMNTFLPFLLSSPREGAMTAIWLALSDEMKDKSGRVFGDGDEIPMGWCIERDVAKGEQQTLWTMCENLTNSTF